MPSEPPTEESAALQARWDERYRESPETEPQAARVLTENRHLLPAAGDALDLACGLGGNALLLARAGLNTEAWDLSPVAVERLQRLADRQGLKLTARVRDLERHPPEPASRDLITVSHYLHRPLIPRLIEALRPGGLIFYQTFTRIAVSDRGPANPDWRLDDNELLRLFAPLRLRVYREENRLGDTRRGLRDLALLVAEKPAP